MDSYEDGYYTIGGYDPCPFCNTEAWLKTVLDNEEFASREEALEWVEKMREKWGAEHAKKDDTPVPADLEEAARKSAIAPFNLDVDEEHLYEYPYLPIAEQKFIEGAKWQAEQLLKSSPLPEDTVLFNKGVEEGKRLMMEEAVKWLVDDDYDELTDKGGFILGSVGIGYNGYYIPYGDLLKLPKEDEK